MDEFCKNLTGPKNVATGRCRITGHITVRHKGGGCKFLFRKINFTNICYNSVILGIIYDPNRNAFVALNFELKTKKFFNSIAILNTYPGSLIACQNLLNNLKIGYRTQLLHITTGTQISCISKNVYFDAQYCRSAGTYCQILQKTKLFCKIKLPSNFVLTLPSTTYATIGGVSNIYSNKINIGKAGRNRLLNKRPSVRGIAMNPVDHPHGGRTNGGKHPVTPWGIPTKGKPTVKKKKS